jgi:flagellar FliL protein
MAASISADTIPAAGAKPAGGKTLRKLLVGLAVLLAAGGASAWFMLKPAHKPATAEHAPRVEPIYVGLDPPFVVNFESNGAVRFLQVTVQAMATTPDTAELIKRHDPVIRNALLMLFSGQSYDTLSTRAGKEKLRNDALLEVRRVVTTKGGKGDDVKDLYFTSFVMQ